MAGLNAEPTLFLRSEEHRSADEISLEADVDVRDPVDSLEVFGTSHRRRARPSSPLTKVYVCACARQT